MKKLKWAFDSVFRMLVRSDEMGTLGGEEVMDEVFFDAEDQTLGANSVASASETVDAKKESKCLNAKDDVNCGTTVKGSPAVLGK